jgi:hypothetical protein
VTLAMALQTSIDTLTSRLRSLADAVNRLRLTAVEDRPSGAEQMVLETVAATVEELNGWVAEALAEASAAGDALARNRDIDTVLRRLTACHERVNRLCGGALVGLVSYETHAQLARLARENGGEWPGWLATLRLGLDSCGPPHVAVQAALLESWREAAPAHPVLADANSQWRCSP